METLKRINAMEDNNAAFKALTPYGKCIAFAADQHFDRRLCDEFKCNGSGYQFTHFADPKVAIAVSQDPLAGPAVDRNNKQCKLDKACKK